MNPFDQFDTPTAQNPFDQFDAPVSTQESGFQPLSEYLASFGGSLTKEKILGDERLMGTVRDNLRTRFGDRSLLVSGVTSALGGATADYTESLSDEEAFEMWQNYHRSFAGGQSVTTANELAYITKADDATKAKMSEGYELFDSMGNIFTGDGTWSETFDGLGDYLQAAIWDPTTVASFGIGRAFSVGGSKAAAQAIKETARTTAKTVTRQALQKGVAREVAVQAGREAATVGARQAFLKLGASRVVQFGGFDAVASVLSDAGYQAVQQDVGRQADWNYGQSAIAAVGVLALPAMMTAGKVAASSVQALTEKSPNLRRIFENYDGIKKATAGKGPAEVEKAVRERMDLNQVNESLRQSFSDFLKNKDTAMSWDAAKAASREFMEEEAVDPSVLSPTNKFLDTFLFGGPLTENGPHGLVVEASRAGFVYVERTKDDKVTNWIGDLISWLDDDVVETAIRSFDEINNTNVMDELAGLGQTSLKDNLAAAWKLTGSEAGYRLLLSRKGADLLRGEGNFAKVVADNLEAATTKKKEVPAPAHYIQSVWKRLLTAHPGTTGLNVKGWAMMSLSNTVSDFALGVVNYGQAAGALAMGSRSSAKQFLTMGNGAILSSVRRGFMLLDPESQLDEARRFFDANPKIAKDIFRELSGDVGATDAAKRFNMNEASRTIKTTEAVVHSLQKATGVVLQDEITKQLSFMANLDRALLRKFGKTYTEFMQTPNSFVELRSNSFAEAVAQATDRTLRETASKSWMDSSQGWWTKRVANWVEAASNDAIAGYAIPFGRFFNTSIAFFGDYTMLNFINHSLKRVLNKEAIDPLSEEGAELFAKGVVGLSALWYMSNSAEEKIDQGLAWYQELDSDGFVKDVTYDFPESYMRGVAQVIAHYRKDGEPPKELVADVGMLVVGQTFRAGQEGIQAATNLYFDLTSGDLQLGFESAASMLGAFGTNIVSGATRPLDPINQLAAMLSEEGGIPDRRQAVEALRYVDQIPSLIRVDTGVPKRATATRGTDLPTDMGRVLGGVRGSPMPNPVEKVFNSIGTASWREIRWEGDPKVKNRMDEIIDPLINTRVMAMLEENPDFFDMPLELRKMAVDMAVKAAIKDTKEIIKVGFGDDAVINVMNQLATQPKAKVRRVLKMMGIEQSVEELAEMPGGAEKLKTLLYLVKDYDDILEGGIK